MLFYLCIADTGLAPLGIVDQWIHQYPLNQRLKWAILSGLV